MKLFERQTYAHINVDAAVNNFRKMAALANNSQTLAVIKADAYGHGAVAIAKALTSDAHGFAVAFIDEAIQLREQGIEQPILLLEGVMSRDEMKLAHEKNFWVMLHRSEHFDWLLTLDAGQRPHIWIKVDTGMHRLGIEFSEIDSLLTAHSELLRDSTVLCSHLACADEPDNGFTLQQTKKLTDLANQYGLAFSLANSAGILQWPISHGSWNRLGIALYGCAQPPTNKLVELQPVMTLSAPIIALRTLEKGDSVGYGQSWVAQRTTTLATVAIGYADGYPRHASANTPAWLHGKRIALVGRVSMDMSSFDVTDLPQVEVNDKVELWGEHLSVAEVAECASTISYELLTRISPRVKRIYTSTAEH
ncbi:alanine racemase [uncultured Paraglaciecola sp.]|uniref:alanine racemase n=1 Tax=uncultured Paraglaciecola sp. TaxID=1765024 RepID=UPI002602AE31|nr:alanine racemase [uncultured Paraglaciecola sp.]